MVAGLGLALSTGAARSADRDLCTDRPGLTSPACTLEEGRAALELNALDVARYRKSSDTQSTASFGDALFRFGVTDSAEARLNWTPFGIDRSRDPSSGTIKETRGIGDVAISFRQNIVNPDGSGVAFSLQPSLRLPSGRSSIGDGTWSAGLIAPLTVALSDKWQFLLTPEVDAAANGGGGGRHLAYGGAVGLSYAVSERWTIGADVSGQRDLDPGNHQTLVLLDGNVKYAFPGGAQVLFGQVNLGLTEATPRTEVLFGFATRLN